jgi:hypothetical protein
MYLWLFATSLFNKVAYIKWVKFKLIMKEKTYPNNNTLPSASGNDDDYLAFSHDLYVKQKATTPQIS